MTKVEYHSISVSDHIFVLQSCCCIFDQVEGVEHKPEVKAGTGSSFRRHFGEKPIFVFFGFFQLGCHSPYKVRI